MNKTFKIGDHVRHAHGITGVITSISPCGRFYRLNGGLNGYGVRMLEHTLPPSMMTDEELAKEYRANRVKTMALVLELRKRGYALRMGRLEMDYRDDEVTISKTETITKEI